MAETKLSASQIIITASDIGAAGAYETMPEPSVDNLGQLVQYTGTDTTGEIEVVSGIVHGEYFAEGDNYTITIDFDKDTFNSYNEYTQTHPITSDPNVSLDIVYAGNPEKGYLTVTYNTDNVLEVEIGLNGGISTAMTKAVMASVGFGVANDEEPFNFYGEEPIELVLPTIGTGEAYTQGYFYKCVSNGNGENSIASDPVTIVDFPGKSSGAVGPTSIMFSRDVYYKYDPNHYMLYGGEQNVELVVESDEYEEAVVYFDGEDGPSTRVRITQELDVEAAFAQMGFYITFAEGYGMPEYIMCDMPAEYSSNESAVTIEKHITVGDADLSIKDAIAFGNAFCLDDDTPVTSQVKFISSSTNTENFNWENLTTGETGSTTPGEYNSFMFTEKEEYFTEGDYFIVQYTNNNSESGYSWERVNVQPTPSGLPDQMGNSGKFLTTDGTDASWATVDALPSQSGNSGKFLTTDGTDASWAGNVLLNTSNYRTPGYALTIMGVPATGPYGLNIGRDSTSGSDGSIAIGRGAKGTGQSSVGIGDYAEATGRDSSCIGYYSKAAAQSSVGLGTYARATANYSIQLGRGTNSEDGTFCVGSRYNNTNVNYKMMDADGTIPTDRFTGSNTTPANAGQYMLTITKDSNGNITRSWEPVVAPSTPATTPVLQGTSTYWIEDQVTHIIAQTITVQGVTASNTIFVAPAPASSADYAAAGIICTAQNTNQLTFTCTTIPTNDIEVNVVIL